MNKTLLEFINKHIHDLRESIQDYNEGADALLPDENFLYATIRKTAKIFKKIIPFAEDELLWRSGCAEEDAETLIGMLEVYVLENTNKDIINQENNEVNSIVFISHSSLDSSIGEAFVDLLLEFGVDINNIFFSSKYHLGVELGKDFVSTVKGKLIMSAVTIFLITDNFYDSAYCLNEMGACWILGKEFIPVLLNDTKFEDMQGFIDQRHIGANVDSDDLVKIYNYLVKRGLANKSCEKVKDKCNTFIESIYDTNLKNTVKQLKNKELSHIEKEIIEHRFTDGELIIFDYFIKNQTDFLDDSDTLDEYGNVVTVNTLNQWINSYSNFDYKKSRELLISSEYLYETRDYKKITIDKTICLSDGTKIKIDYFRDLINLSDESKQLIYDAVKKHISGDNPKAIKQLAEPAINLENLILFDKLKDEEKLLFNYMLLKGKYTLGDRWMAEREIKDIKAWEIVNELDNTLSRKYHDTLNLFITRKFLKVKSRTAYGNPRQYELIEPLLNQILNLSKKASEKLANVLEEYIELPF